MYEEMTSTPQAGLNLVDTVFNSLNNAENMTIIMAVYIMFAVAMLFLRLFAHSQYNGTLYSIKRDTSKEVKSIKDVTAAGRIKNSLLRAAVADYISVAERAVTTISTTQIVEMHAAKLSLIFWRLDAIDVMLNKMDVSLLISGLGLAFIFSDYALVFGTLGVLAFVLLKMFSSLCNLGLMRAQLVGNIVMFIEREVGRFFVADTGGAILRLRETIDAAFKTQAKEYLEMVREVSTILKESAKENAIAMQESTKATSSAITLAIGEKLDSVNVSFSNTLKGWEGALTEATQVQTTINDAAERMQHAGARLQSSSELLATHLQGHSNALSTQLVSLLDAISTITEAVSQFSAHQEALLVQGKYIERNQHALDSTLFAYEESLKGLTQSIGDGLGTFINLHAQTSAQVINDALKANIEKSMGALTRGSTNE